MLGCQGVVQRRRATMIYVPDGRRIHSPEGFGLVMGEAVTGSGGYFGRTATPSTTA